MIHHCLVIVDGITSQLLCIYPCVSNSFSTFKTIRLRSFKFLFNNYKCLTILYDLNYENGWFCIIVEMNRSRTPKINLQCIEMQALIIIIRPRFV